MKETRPNSSAVPVPRHEPHYLFLWEGISFSVPGVQPIIFRNSHRKEHISRNKYLTKGDSLYLWKRKRIPYSVQLTVNQSTSLNQNWPNSYTTEEETEETPEGNKEPYTRRKN